MTRSKSAERMRTPARKEDQLCNGASRGAAFKGMAGLGEQQGNLPTMPGEVWPQSILSRRPGYVRRCIMVLLLYFYVSGAPASELSFAPPPPRRVHALAGFLELSIACSVSSITCAKGSSCVCFYV